MGCFSSKHDTRSRSLRDDFSMSLQRRAVGIPGLEDLFTSSNNSSTVAGGDDLLALLCTANTVAMRLKEREDKLQQMSEGEEDRPVTSYDSGTDDPALTNGQEDHRPGEEEIGEKDVAVCHETINAWELLADLEEVDQAADAKPAHVGQLETVSDVGNEGSCVDQKCLTSPLLDDTPVDKQVISTSKIIADAAPVATRVCPAGHILEEAVVELEKKPVLEIPTELLKTLRPAQASSPAASDSPGPPPKGLLDYSLSFRFDGSFALDYDPHKEPAAASADMGNRHRGVRRKARARDLKPLEVPAFEFKDIQLWMRANEQPLYQGSDDPYETPKFGKYIRSIAAKATRDDGEFDPELVAALQETIDGMTAEEDRILKQFIEEVLGQVQGGGGSS